tara:strand:- start:1355 stop:1642 length:288 start_codon:yes stop_codon:yes gene_type:complete
MGGIARLVSRVFSSGGGGPAAPIKAVLEPIKAKAVEAGGKMIGATKSDYGSGTIMGAAAGDESEANVGKTVLGGGYSKKKKNKTAATAPAETPVA